MTDLIKDILLNANPVVTTIMALLTGLVLWAYRESIGPVIAAILNAVLLKKFPALADMAKPKKAAPDKPEPKSGLRITETHSYRYPERCLVSNAEDLFSDVDLCINGHRKLAQECAFDFSKVKAMNVFCRDGLLKTFRKAIAENNIYITVVFPKNIVDKTDAADDRLRFLYEKLVEEIKEKETVTMCIVLDTRAAVSLKYDLTIFSLRPEDAIPIQKDARGKQDDIVLREKNRTDD